MMKSKHIIPLFTLAHFSHHLCTEVLVPLLPLLRRDLGLNYFESGVLVSSFSLSYGLGQIPMALLADRFSRRSLIVLGLVGISLSTTAVGLTNAYWQMVPCFIALGLLGALLRHQLATDPEVTLFGEDIEDPKGDVFGITKGLSTEFPGRVENSPLTESTIVAVLGGLLGLGLAVFGIRALISVMPPEFPRVHEIGLSPRVLFYTAAVTMLTGLIFGLAPALQSSKTSLTETLSEGGRGGTGGQGHLPHSGGDRLPAGRPLLLVAVDALGNHHGIVHQHANSQHVPHHGEDIEGDPHEIHEGHGDEQAEGHGQGHDQGGRNPAQEEVEHQHGEEPAQEA